jgi:hypothetical protein
MMYFEVCDRQAKQCVGLQCDVTVCTTRHSHRNNKGPVSLPLLARTTTQPTTVAESRADDDNHIITSLHYITKETLENDHEPR